MPINFLSHLPRWARCLLALGAGALLPLTLAPWDLWYLALPSLALLGLLLRGVSGRTALLLTGCFGLGMYGFGVSWIYVSIHQFGGAAMWLAALLTGLFVLGITLIFALPWWAYGRWFSRQPMGLLLAFPAFWLLGEWLRGWLLTGFPWLYLGYGHLDTWLSGWAPVVGVMGLGLILAFTASCAAQWLAKPGRQLWLLPAGALCALLWLSGLLLQSRDWTETGSQPIAVAMVQPNIPQDLKWEAAYRQYTLEKLLIMSDSYWGNDLLIWPEAAVPITYHRALPFLEEVNQLAADTGTGLITGIIYDDFYAADGTRYYNSIAGFGDAMGIYHKRRLVPFGEYVPLERWLRGLIHFFDLPTSIVSRGPADQGGLQLGEWRIAPSICYEVVYPDLVASSARDAELLLTISNDAWFADSIGPLQHMQMAQMRALETGRYLIRSTNNGISALVDKRGQIIVRSEQFVDQTLSGDVYPSRGLTPFMRWGHRPLALGCLLLLALLAWRGRLREQHLRIG